VTREQGDEGQGTENSHGNFGFRAKKQAIRCVFRPFLNVILRWIC
jgi:hypothetical protein